MGDVRVANASRGVSTYAAKHVGLDSLLQWGLSLLLLAVPFHSVLVLPGVSVVKAIGFILAPIWLIWLVAALGTRRGPWIMPRRNVCLTLSFGVFVCSILLSVLYAPTSPIFRTSLLTIVSFAAMAVVIYTLVSSEALLRRAYTCLALGGTVFGMLVIVQFVAPQEVAAIFGQRVFEESIGVRATGPFRDPNYGALTLVVLACLSFFLALTQRRRWQRTLLLLGVSTELVAVLLTFSRAAYVLLGLMGLVVLWRERRRLRLWKVAIVATIGLVLLASFGEGLLTLATSRAGTLAEFVQLLGKDPGQARQLDLSLWYRFQLLRAGVKMAFDKFPIGVGWENFRYQVTRYSEEVPEQGAHNTYVAVGAELGLPGILSLAWLLWALWGSTSRLCRIAQDRIGLLARGTRYGLLAILIGGLFLTVLHEAVVWALIGLIMAQNQVVFRAAKARETSVTVG
ncbi:O-antigen ligase family protein [Candidatus Bipolaricaulota bacterium]|nr:O-antigen ligase family protein [Candidatus Bipolaricaulota bacterium]